MTGKRDFINTEKITHLRKFCGFGRMCHISKQLLRSESPSGKCAKLYAVAASNNKDHAPQSLFTYASHYFQSFTS